MKTTPDKYNKRTLSIIIILLFCNSTILIAQIQTYMGFSIGYGILDMGEVNKDIIDTFQKIKTANIIASAPNIRAPEPEEIKGGMYIDANLLMRFEKISLGASVNYIAGKGNYSYSDYNGSSEERYDASTYEFMGIIGTDIPFYRVIKLSFRGYAGYGLASAKHAERTHSIFSQDDNVTETNRVSGGYFCSRLQGGFGIFVEPVVLNFSIGYRIANAGRLVGEMIRNDVKYGDMGIENVHGSDTEFDYSGISFLAGIEFRIFGR
jgi:hypothetical protein